MSVPTQTNVTNVAPPGGPRHESCLMKGSKGFLRVMGYPFLVEVLGVEGKQIWVSFPGADYPVEGMGAQLEFHQDTGYVLYHTQVVRGPRQLGDGVIVERSETSDERRHRANWRVPTNLAVVIQEAGSGTRYSAIMENLSAGGLLLRAYANLNLKNLLNVTFELEDGEEHTVVGKVVYAAEESSLSRRPNQEYGVSFVEVPNAARRAITLFLYAKIRQLYPKEVQAMYPRSPRT